MCCSLKTSLRLKEIDLVYYSIHLDLVLFQTAIKISLIIWKSFLIVSSRID